MTCSILQLDGLISSSVQLPRPQSNLIPGILTHTTSNRILNPPMSNTPFKNSSGKEDDANSKIKYLRNLHGLHLEALNDPHHEITSSLVDTLAERVKGEAGHALEDINEIVALCQGLLTSDAPPDFLISAFQALTRAVLDDFSRGKQSRCLDQAIGCLRGALNACPPGFHHLSLNLSNLLVVRFLMFRIDDDYREAKTVLHNVTHSPSSRALPDAYQIQASTLTSALVLARSLVHSSLGDREGAVSRCRSFLEHLSLFGDPLHPVITDLLASSLENASKHTDLPQSAQATHLEVHSLPFSVHLDTFGNRVNESDSIQTVSSLEEKIKRLRHLRSTTLPGTDRQRKYLNELVDCYNVKVSLTHDATDIEAAIKYRRMVLATTHPSDPSTSFHLSSLGSFLFSAYEHTRSVKYLDDSITHHREVLQLDSTHLTDFFIIRRLIDSLSIRWKLFSLRNDLDEVMRLFASGVQDSYATVPSRFDMACRWANTARIFRHISVLTAYNTAMSLMQESLVFAPTLSIQHDLLVEKHDLYEKTPLNFASHLIRAGQLERAIETLEQGRALLWSEMRGLRTSTNRLRAEDPVLAERFTAINQELEVLTKSGLPNGSVGTDGGEFEGDEWMAQFPGLIAKQQKLLEERGVIVSKIRGLPGFENFLLPLPFDTLRSAASNGPVIIINHCKWRSDIIIISHDSPPSLITRPYSFFGWANGLKDKLLGMRQLYGLGSKEYARALVFVLKDLYELIGGPVIKRFTELGIPEQSRVWWCPTSVFGYLPLHAMGPIPSSGNKKQYFSDIYISSYTSTLSALIASRNSGARDLSLPNILLVAQPNPFLPGVSGEINVLQNLDIPVTSLISQSATPTAVLDALLDHRFCHFACHGGSPSGNPFDASFILYKEPLMLLDIVRSRIPTGECAFLAACHTAELSDGSIPDEALHLSAAMQYSGFRSVIGTMWEMADEDGQYLAKYFYKSIFSDESQGVPYYERSAKALAAAVRKLRGRGVGPERWVNYVHFGA